ncbi:MAG: aldehyde dehydrogenase [Phycisphaerae bacterium]|nr:aldehyde dehydrogenase [Phycisphaerae bacterium]
MQDILKNYIDGQWLLSPGGKTFANENPARKGEILNYAQASEPEEITLAVDAASAAFLNWKTFPVEERQRLVGEFLRLLAQAKDELAVAVSKENGKTLTEARAEVDSALLEGGYHQRQISAFAGNAVRNDKCSLAWEDYHPLGVVGIISPWNYPVNVMCRKTLPALLTGNTIVFKPASFTPWSAVMMARLFEKAGFPAGVFNCVTGMGSSVGNALIADSRIKAISFTGSTAVGKKILSAAGANLVRTQLELGGKNAMIVMNDADLDGAVDATVKAGFGCAGQWCTSTSRVLLQRDIAGAYLEKLAERCRAIRIGDPLDSAVDMGPVAGPGQFKTITTAIERAQRDGAQMLCGDAAAQSGGYFIKPTVFTGVTPDMAIFSEEIFGPVLAVCEFDTLPEALDLTNNSVYGLSSAIFTRDLTNAQRYIDAIDTGMAHVNIHSGFKIPEMPFGGWKESGFGLPENSRSGLEFFVNRKAVYWKGI